MAVRTFAIRTFGCQMTAHDSDKVANLLLHAGYAAMGEDESADLLVVNTCSIREKAAHRLYSDLGRLREWKALRPGRLLGIGGCVAQQEGDALLARFGHVDIQPYSFKNTDTCYTSSFTHATQSQYRDFFM